MHSVFFCSGAIAFDNGAFKHLHVTGTTCPHPTRPGVQCIYIANASLTTSGIEMAFSGGTMDF